MIFIRTLARLSPILAIGLGSVACDGAWAEPEVPQNATGNEPLPGVSPAPNQVQTTTALPPPQQSGEVTIGDTDQSEQDDFADTDPSALHEFREPLAPYGTWVDDGTYGTVWVPSPTVVGQDFVPYETAGHWAYDSDYVWVSDYSWGWAPFHYGRWIYAGNHWAWIPGRRYSGAWVSWRTGPSGFGYVGWAPLAPYWYWHDGYAYNWYRPWGEPRYVYCPTHAVFYGNVGGYAVHNGAQYEQARAGTREYIPASPAVASNGANGGARPGSRASVVGRHGPDPRHDLGITSDVPAVAQSDRARMFASPRAMAASNVVARAPSATAAAAAPTFTSRSSSWTQQRPSVASAPQAAPPNVMNSPAGRQPFNSGNSSPSVASPPSAAAAASPSWSSRPSYNAPSFNAPSAAAPVPSPSPAPPRATFVPRATGPVVNARPSAPMPSMPRASVPSQPSLARPSAAPMVRTSPGGVSAPPAVRSTNTSRSSAVSRPSKK